MRFRNIVLTVMVAFALAGCASSGTKVTEEQVSELVPGKTTKTEIVALIGQPDDISINDNGDRVFTYKHTRARTKGINYVPIVGLFAGGVNTKTSTTILLIGRDDVLKDITSLHDVEGEVKTGVISD